MRRTTFREAMAGLIRVDGERSPITLELTADLPAVLTPWADLEGTIFGRVAIEGLADDGAAAGTLRVAPIVARRIRYRLDFTAYDGRRLHLDGWKSLSAGHPLRSMTRLPATITDDSGNVVAEAQLRFDIRRNLARFLAGFRFPRAPEPSLLDSRWHGQPGRLEVWYTTLTDAATGTGVWLHHELVAPTDGSPARAHGWATVFPPGVAPVFARFGPYDWAPGKGYKAGDVELSSERLRGEAGEISWDLAATGGGAPLYTFPRWAWQRELLPAAQIVPIPTGTYDGTVRWGDQVLEVAGAPGNTARIYGHGNAKRWAWLHADLGGGNVCEVVAAVSTRPGLSLLPPLVFVRLRLEGEEWPPGNPLTAALAMRAQIDLPMWSIRGRRKARRIDIEVTQPPGETVAVDYADPDGAPAVCRNTERAHAVITLQRMTGLGWEIERRWELHGTAHAEVGTRE